MSLHLGHIYGLHLIKQAISPKTTADDTEHYTHEPIGEGSDSGSRRISESFDSLPERDKMIPEDPMEDPEQKVAAEAAFDSDRQGMNEDRDQDDGDPDREPQDHNYISVNTDKAWQEHDGYSPMSSDGPVIDHAATPGPAP